MRKAEESEITGQNGIISGEKRDERDTVTVEIKERGTGYKDSFKNL